MQRLPDSHSVIHSFIHSVGQSFRQSTGRLDRQSLQKKKKNRENTKLTHPGARKRERSEVGVRWRQKQNGSLPSSEKLQRNMVAILFSHRYVGPYAPSPFVCFCLYVCICMYFDLVVFFFVYVEASSFHFSLGRVGAVATSSPKNPPPLRKPSFGLYFRLFTFRKLHRQTNGMKGKKKLLSRHPLDVFTRFRCQSCVNYAIKLTWMSFVQHAKQPK